MSNEWFERGVHDAQHDQLNSTYYQHYYYYRLGYDQARRQMRQPTPSAFGPTRHRGALLVGAVLLVAFAAAALYLLQRQSLPIAATSVAPTARPTTRPTLTPLPTPAPTPVPTPAPLTLRVEGFAQIVNTGGAPLRGRAEPGRSAAIVAEFAEGSRVRLLEGPVEADGFIWWRIEGEAGSGWSAQANEAGTPWLEPVQ
jgi:hypothetical protein